MCRLYSFPAGFRVKPPAPKVAGPPALAGKPDAIAGLFEQVGVDRPPRREDSKVVASLVKLPRVPPRQKACSARAALRVVGESVLEQHALARDPIERRRLDPAAPISPGVLIRPVVGNRNQNVRPLGNAGPGREAGTRQASRNRQAPRKNTLKSSPSTVVPLSRCPSPAVINNRSRTRKTARPVDGAFVPKDRGSLLNGEALSPPPCGGRSGRRDKKPRLTALSFPPDSLRFSSPP